MTLFFFTPSFSQTFTRQAACSCNLTRTCLDQHNSTSTKACHTTGSSSKTIFFSIQQKLPKLAASTLLLLSDPQYLFTPKTTMNTWKKCMGRDKSPRSTEHGASSSSPATVEQSLKDATGVANTEVTADQSQPAVEQSRSTPTDDAGSAARLVAAPISPSSQLSLRPSPKIFNSLSPQ